MRKLGKEICLVIHDWLSDHINELKSPILALSDEWKNTKEMLASIKKREEDALWALTELFRWGMGDDYEKEFIVDRETLDDGEEVPIYTIADRDGNLRYFRVDFTDTWRAIEVRFETRLVEVTKWFEV
jgi:hypothetical protein